MAISYKWQIRHLIPRHLTNTSKIQFLQHSLRVKKARNYCQADVGGVPIGTEVKS